ncbi:tyrosine-type recombinase/integrase [Roseinatronobacter alkalisoli]|uniref:Site-specific integrase n=1 Tax=Roseinatronobacter alkalisoli TaxID=3028235 RepID=A0ABT5TER7_9RHOB|nr:site-specific integrase [Roseinatronobacter sp. HJB301]MDD7973616.1 site-specific integrase [Roseinatronobacter sp. HJB301]
MPALLTAADDRARMRYIEFFAATLRNPNTRRAYIRATGDFFRWCELHGIPSLTAVQPVHVATYIEQMTATLSTPTVKQRLAAIRHLFDWLVTGQIVPVNPAASVRGPSHKVRRGRTPVLEPAEARKLLDAIDITTVGGLRDRALIGLMVYSFARIGAALSMKVEDIYTQQRRLWVRLHEKGGGCVKTLGSEPRRARYWSAIEFQLGLVANGVVDVSGGSKSRLEPRRTVDGSRCWPDLPRDCRHQPLEPD